MAKRKDKPSAIVQEQALYIAKVVRDNMEDFHREHLSDAQMQDLNPIIRNAVCTALHAVATYEEYESSKRFVEETVKSIPNYWEHPQLTASFLELVEFSEKRGSG